MKDALAIHRMLLEREVHHEIVRLPRAIANADELPEVLGLRAGRCLVTRVFAVVPRSSAFPAHLSVVIMRAGSTPRFGGLREALDAHTVRTAGTDLINATTDYAAGLVGPLLLPDDMPIFIDQDVIDDLGVDDVVYTATGEPSTALGIRTLDLYAICGAKPIDLRAAPQLLRRATTTRPRG
ncbi:MAG TPA: YbaK/EbsC family protein [Streptosporangiaceae bacterium]|nr:YbaK/EbsC family protein [Streptosporangiaceae bacterium]